MRSFALKRPDGPCTVHVRGVETRRARGNSVIRRPGRATGRAKPSPCSARGSRAIIESARFREQNFRLVAARAGIGARENAYPDEAAPQSRMFAESRRVDR